MRYRPAGLTLLFILTALFAPLAVEAQQAGRVCRMEGMKQQRMHGGCSRPLNAVVLCGLFQDSLRLC